MTIFTRRKRHEGHNNNGDYMLDAGNDLLDWEEEMNNERAIELLKEDLDHTQQHLNYVGKAPEFYEEMKEWCKALEVAIQALEAKHEGCDN